jgi:phage-related protein
MGVVGTAFIEVLPVTGGFSSALNKEVQAAASEAEAKSESTFGKFAQVGQKAILGLGVVAVVGGAFAIKMADQWEAAHARLETAITAAGGSIDKFAGQIKAADSTNEHYGYTNAQTEAALARLTQATNNPTLALKDLAVAVNVAAARHIDLETAATLVGKVAEGNTGILKRYGIDLGIANGGVTAAAKAHDTLAKAEAAVAPASDKLTAAQAKLTIVEGQVTSGHLKGAAAATALLNAHKAVTTAAAGVTKAHEAVAAATTKLAAAGNAGALAVTALGTRFAGSAQAQAETFGGKVKVLEATFQDLGVKVGLWLIPKLELLASILLSGVQFLERHKTAAIALGAVIGGVLVTAIGVYIAELAIATVTETEAGAGFLLVAARAAAAATTWAVEATASLSETIALMAMYAADWVATMATQAASAVAGWATTAAAAIAGAVAWVASMAATAAASIAAGAAMLLPFLPVIAVIAVVIAAAYLLYRNWDTVWGFIKSIASAAADFVRQHIMLIIEIFLPFVAAIMLVKDHWTAIWGAIKAITEAVVSVVIQIFRTLVDIGLLPIRLNILLLQTVWNAVWAGVSAVVQTAWSQMQTVFNFIVNLGLGLITVAINTFKTAWNDAWAGVTKVIQTAWSIIQGIASKISGAVSGIAGVIGGVTGAIGKVGGLFHAQEGGWIPGRPDEPILMVGHGGEFVVSRQMQQNAQQTRSGSPSGPGGGPLIGTIEISASFGPGTNADDVMAAFKSIAEHEIAATLQRVLGMAQAGVGS